VKSYREKLQYQNQTINKKVKAIFALRMNKKVGNIMHYVEAIFALRM